MVPAEIRDELMKLADEIGPHAFVGLDIDTHNRAEPITGCIYPDGIGGNTARISGIKAHTFPAALAALRDTWAKRQSAHAAARTKSMALAIIAITGDQGQCTDAALRQDGFSQSEIDRFGDDAIVAADHYGSNGPFSIRFIAGANAVAAE